MHIERTNRTDAEGGGVPGVRANNDFIALRLSAKHSFSLLLFLLAEKFACNTFRLPRKKYFFRKLFAKEEGQSEKRAKHRKVGCVK